jgi:tetratricopeptide (TPR) repeat protein
VSGERRRLSERRDLVARDLAELAVQVEIGEVDGATADRLRSAYRSELESLETSLADLPEEPDVEPEVAAPISDAVEPPPVRSARPIVIAALAIVAVLSGVILFAARDRGADEPTVQSSPGGLTVDPGDVSNEQLEAIVAANPGITGMRMALADRYFQAEDFGPALDHYLYIAENAEDPADEAQALARIGWMAYRTGLAIEADEYVRTSLEIDPGNAEATLYRGFITLYGLDDAAAAVPQLEEALELPDLSENVIIQIADALDEARGEAP